jgi:hypothetical protein
MLSGFAIKSAKSCPEGKAIRMGDTLFLRPELVESMKGASSEQLELLLKDVKVIDIGKPNFLSNYAPMPLVPGLYPMDW